jgi:hypothetical protein
MGAADHLGDGLNWKPEYLRDLRVRQAVLAVEQVERLMVSVDTGPSRPPSLHGGYPVWHL